MNIKFVNFRNQSQEATIKRFIEEIGSIIPKKVLQLNVTNWDDDGNKEGTTISVNYDTSYHFCELNVYNKYFAQSEEMMKQQLFHEFIHVVISEYTEIVLTDLLQYVKEHNEPLAEQFRRQLVRAEESMVTQLEYFIVESISGQRN